MGRAAEITRARVSRPHYKKDPGVSSQFIATPRSRSRRRPSYRRRLKFDPPAVFVVDLKCLVVHGSASFVLFFSLSLSLSLSLLFRNSSVMDVFFGVVVFFLGALSQWPAAVRRRRTPVSFI